jgi:PIN domain nuclease of toxin-antitoxin system
VIDTHTWLFAVGGAQERIGRKARRVLAAAETVEVPAICQWEVAMLVGHGRISLDQPTREWLAVAGASAPYAVHPLSAEVASVCADLGDEGFHADPADRLIYATARVLDLPLLTGDVRMREFERSRLKSRPRHVVWD